MTVRLVARLLGWGTAAIAVPFAGGSLAGRIGAVVGVGAMGVTVVAIWLWLPRAAHAAFEAGKARRAARRYRVLAALAITARRERAARLSIAACAIVDGADVEPALRALDPATFDSAERAVWLNNRAFAALTASETTATTTTALAALALADEAVELRPDVPAVQHTRGLALLALGRLDDAIAVLDAMRTGGELAPRLEAARCRDLARAWTQKGELAYADDYRARADTLDRAAS